MNKAIGILGGMGPQATVDAMNKIIKNTHAHCDQEHIPVIAVSIPDIPDRTKAIVNQDNEPLEKMSAYLRILENADVGCIIIPCNTAHFWFDQLQQRTDTKMISIIDVTAHFIQKSNTKEICILATSATISTELYQKKFLENHVSFTVPESNIQQQVMQSIYKYKSGYVEESREIMSNIINLYGLSPDRKFLLACTEIPLILADLIEEYPELFVDATEVLIRNAIEWYQNGQQETHS